MVRVCVPSAGRQGNLLEDLGGVLVLALRCKFHASDDQACLPTKLTDNRKGLCVLACSSPFSATLGGGLRWSCTDLLRTPSGVCAGDRFSGGA